MATPISRDILNKETNALFWAQTGHKPGQRLDPNNPLDKAQMPVWMDIFRKVKAKADAGTLVITYDRPEVAQPLADAEVASAVAAAHVDAGAKAPDPATAQQHVAAAATAAQVFLQRLSEAAANQPPTVSSKLKQDAAREAAKTPPPPHAPAVDQIAHAQMQNGQVQNGQFLRPEDDPWDPRYVPKSKPPREQPPAQPPKSPRERPSREVLDETNMRFWNRTQYKRGQKLDMSDAQDREMSKIWMEIFGEVQREANEGRLTFTSPELVPAPNGVRPPPPRPSPPPPPPRPTPQLPLPSQPSAQQQPYQPPPQQPYPLPQQPYPLPQQPPYQPPPPRVQPSMQPYQPPPPQPYQPPAERPLSSALSSSAAPPSAPGSEADTPAAAAADTPAAAAAAVDTAAAEPEGMSTTAKIALGVFGLGGLAAIVYAVTRKPTGKPASSRPRARAAARVSSGSVTPAIGSSSFAFPPLRSGKKF